MPAPGDSGGQHFVGSRLTVDKAEIGNLQNPAASNIVVTDADQTITGVKGGTFRDWSGAVYNICSSANPSGVADPTGVAAATASIAAAVAALETTSSTVAGGMIVAPQGTFKVDAQTVITNPNPNFTGGVIFQGAGKLATILKPTTALGGVSSVVKFLNSRDCSIRDMRILGTPSGAAVDAAVESANETGGAVIAHGNEFRNLICGNEGAGGMNKALKFTSTINANNEQHTVYHVEERNCGTAAISIESNNSLQHDIVRLTSTAPVGIVTNGGSYSVIGGAFGNSAWTFQIAAGTQRHPCLAVGISAEGNAGFLQAAAAVTGGWFQASACEGIFGVGTGALIDFKATSSRLRLGECDLATGSDATINLDDVNTSTSIVGCGLGMKTGTWAGKLYLAGNHYYPGGGVVWTPTGSAAKVQVGDEGGGFTVGSQNMTGTMTQYAGDTTAGIGLASVLGKISLTAQTASISPVTIYTPAAAGDYLVLVHVECTVAGTGGTVQVNAVVQDDLGGYTQGLLASALSLAGLGKSSATYCWHQVGGAAIQYSTTVAGATGSPQYAVYLILIRMS